MLLSACGDSGGGSSFGGSTPNSDAPATGQGQVDAACDGQGEVSGQILVLTDPNQQLKSAPATLTLTQTGGQPKTYTTDADGNYTIKDLDVNEYELEASLPGGLDGKTIEPRKKYMTVDDCYIETVSMVLLAQGIQAPAAPAPSTSQPQVVYVNNQPHYSIANNPFFWLWLFDRPNYYGYSYPPVYTTRIYNNNNIIYVPQQRPLPDTRYKYTTYADSSTSSTKSPGVKAAPSPVSKGTTRLGTSGYSKPPDMKTPSSSGSSGSKGSTRNGSSSTGSQSGVKTPASSSSNKDSVPHPSGSSGDSVPHPSGSSNSSSSSKSGSSSSGSSSSKSGSSSSSSKSGSSSSKGGTRGGKR
jgi:hypothetical protein